MQAVQKYHLHSQQDGSLEGKCWTNDDEDLGIPSAEADWEVRYKNRTDALKQTGGTHVGVSGVQVSVYIDGIQVNQYGQSIH